MLLSFEGKESFEANLGAHVEEHVHQRLLPLAFLVVLRINTPSFVVVSEHSKVNIPLNDPNDTK